MNYFSFLPSDISNLIFNVLLGYPYDRVLKVVCKRFNAMTNKSEPEKKPSSLLFELCRRGELNLIAWSWKDFKMDDKNYAMAYASFNGQLETAKWLYNTGHRMINLNAINAACAGGHLKVLEWMSIQPMFLSIQNVCMKAAETGQLDVFVWGIKLFGCERLDCMVAAMRGGHTNILEWIYKNCDMTVQDVQKCILMWRSLDSSQSREDRIKKIVGWWNAKMVPDYLK